MLFIANITTISCILLRKVLRNKYNVNWFFRAGHHLYTTGLDENRVGGILNAAFWICSETSLYNFCIRHCRVQNSFCRIVYRSLQIQMVLASSRKSFLLVWQQPFRSVQNSYDLNIMYQALGILSFSDTRQISTQQRRIPQYAIRMS